MPRFVPLPAFCLLFIFLTPVTMLAAKSDADRFQINRDIQIQPDDHPIQMNHQIDQTGRHCESIVLLRR